MTTPQPELGRLKLALTSDCGLRCSYCFIDKERGETIARAVGSRILRAVIGAPGQKKRIGIYGGEPLAHFPLLKDLILRARSYADRLRKEVFLSVATNGLLLNERRLAFFRREDVHLCVSIDGADHDLFRVHRDGSGSLRGLLPKIAAAFARMPVSRLTALQGVHPQNAAALFDNVAFIRGLGFETVNFEMIQGVPWDAPSRRGFVRGFKRVADDIVRRIRLRQPVFFIQSVNRELAELAGAAVATETLEVYPDGSIASLPYPFRHLEEQIARGRAQGEVLRAGRALGAGSAMVRIRQALSRGFARRLIMAARRDRHLSGYVERAVVAGARS